MQAGMFRERGFWLSSLLALMILALAFPSAAQDENYCRTEISEMMEVGDTLTGVITSNIPFAFYCFEGERGDTITVSVDAIDERLIPQIVITDPVFDEEDLQNPLGYGEANRAGGTAEAVFEIDATDTYLIVVLSLENTLGTFEISLSAEGSSIFGETEEPGGDPTEEPGEDPTDEPENDDDDGNGSGSTDPEEVIPGETNLCRVEGTEFLEYGDEVTGELDDRLPLTWFCFEGNAGDVVTLEAGTESGDVVVLMLIAEPFFDLSDDTIYDVAQARNRNDTAELEFVVPEDGDYLIWIQVTEEGQEGEFYLEIEGEAGVVLDCTTEPLSGLVNQQWVIASGTESNLVNLNLTCDGFVIITTMGASAVGFYDISQDGVLSFSYGSEFFTSVSLDETGWTIANSEGTEYQFVPVAETTCSDETMTALINASWVLEGPEGDLFFSFSCNGIYVLSSEAQVFALDYTFEEGDLTLVFPDGVEYVFEDVVIEGDELMSVLDGEEFIFENVLAD